MIDGVLRLADRSVRAIMTPRAEVAWIDARPAARRSSRRSRRRDIRGCSSARARSIAPVGFVDARDILPRALQRGRSTSAR